ncbi:hypothetical protein JW979_12085, partial [bacterium]|nr:hypothetical protein [candidate division CSSED10-310 bacterium]
ATEIFIPFERIDHIEITDNNSAISAELPWVSLHITLNDQTDLEMSVKSDYEVTGKTSYGQFRVRIDHVKTIDF